MNPIAGLKDKVVDGFQGLMSKIPTPGNMMSKAYEWLCGLPVVGPGIQWVGQKIGLESAPAGGDTSAGEGSTASGGSELTTSEPVGERNAQAADATEPEAPQEEPQAGNEEFSFADAAAQSEPATPQDPAMSAESSVEGPAAAESEMELSR